MLDDARRMLVFALVIVAVATAAIATASFDPAAARRALPALGGDEAYDVDVSSFSARGLVSGDAMLTINEARLERDVLAAVRGLAGSQAAAAPPGSLESMSDAPGTATVRRALDGIPRRELSVEAFVQQPTRALDTWRAEVLVDVRPIAGDAPNFATPTSEVVLEVLPYGEPGAGIVERWHVRRLTLERGGLLGLSRDVVYVRRGNVGVVAPVEDAWYARDVATIAAELQPGIRRRYRGLSEGRAAFIALVPTRVHVRRVFGEAAMPADAIGTAYDDRRMAILLSSYRWDMYLSQRDLLRHELTHLATSRFARSYGYALYVEGLAEWEGNHEIVESGTFYIENGPAVELVASGEVDLDELLFEVDSFDDLDGDDGYRLGMLVVDHIESTYGHAKALRFYAQLGEGVEPRVAVRRVFRTSPAAFRNAVRSWMLSHRTWTG